MQRDRSEVFGQGEQIVEVLDVQAGDGGVDLHLDPGLYRGFDAAHGTVEGPGNAAELVVQLGCGEVDADGDARDAELLHLAGRLGRDQCAVGRHHRAQAGADRVLNNLPDVLAHEGVATRQDEDRVAERYYVVDDGLGLLQVEFARVGTLLRRCTTVHAGEVARTGDLPGDKFGGVGDPAGLRGRACGRRGRDVRRMAGLPRDSRIAVRAAVRVGAHGFRGTMGIRSPSQRAASLAW